jgi:glucose-6-phosphate 1-epimerase
MRTRRPVEAITLEGAPALRWYGPDGSCATLLLRGAQLLSWRTAGGQELLYRSPSSLLKGAAPVRGGVPVVFPQFGAQGPLSRHGFARERLWQRQAATPEEVNGISLQLDVTADDEPLWRHACRCTLRIALQPDQLRIHLEVVNTGTTPFSFSAALHSYFSVSDIGNAALQGALEGGAWMPLQGPIDRVLSPKTNPLRLWSGAYWLDVQQTGFDQVVVWNPGPEACIPDLPTQDHRHFVCIEPAVVGPPVVLLLGGNWWGDTVITYNRALIANPSGPKTPHGQPSNALRP